MLKEIVMAIITKSHETELKILNVTCDMGSCNRAMWREFGIQVGKTGQPVFSVPHPVEPKLKLHFMANVPHVVKNIKVALVNGQQIDVDGRYVSIKPVEALAKLQENRELKIAPKLKLKLKQLQAPSLFDKMKVSNATNIISNSVAKGLEFMVANKLMDEELVEAAGDTAWLISLLNS